MKNEIITCEKQIVTFSKMGNGHIVRNTKTRLGFTSQEVPSIYMDAGDLLSRFYKLNSSLPHCNGFKTYKREWPHASFHLFAFCDRFAICVEQDRDADSHPIRLKYHSTATNQWYWFASGKTPIETDYFYRTTPILATLQTMIRCRKFRLSPLADEGMEIPIG